MYFTISIYLFEKCYILGILIVKASSSLWCSHTCVTTCSSNHIFLCLKRFITKLLRANYTFWNYTMVQYWKEWQRKLGAPLRYLHTPMLKCINSFLSCILRLHNIALCLMSVLEHFAWNNFIFTRPVCHFC